HAQIDQRIREAYRPRATRPKSASLYGSIQYYPMRTFLVKSLETIGPPCIEINHQYLTVERHRVVANKSILGINQIVIVDQVYFPTEWLINFGLKLRGIG